MSTNYYLRHKPTQEQIDELKKCIDSTVNGQNFFEVLELAKQMYATCDEYEQDNGEMHIGKRSDGWKFLWCPNVHYTPCIDKETGNWVTDRKIEKKYELTKKGITDYIMQDEFVVVDEYGDIQDKTEFLDMAFNWCTDGYDSLSYSKDYDGWDMSHQQKIFKEMGIKFDDKTQSDFYSDGLRFSINDFL